MDEQRMHEREPRGGRGSRELDEGRRPGVGQRRRVVNGMAIGVWSAGRTVNRGGGEGSTRTPVGNGSVENRVARAGRDCREFAARRGSSQRELPGRRTDLEELQRGRRSQPA